MTKSAAMSGAARILHDWRPHTTTDGAKLFVPAPDEGRRPSAHHVPFRYLSFVANRSRRWAIFVVDPATGRPERDADAAVVRLPVDLPAGCRRPDQIAAAVRAAVEAFEAAVPTAPR